jgi:hypothetical protein
MQHVLSEHGLCLTYLCDPTVIGELDQDRILEDLSDDAPGGDPLPWLTRYRLADYDHLVLVTDQLSGHPLAFLAASDAATTQEDFLLLETAFVTPTARGRNLTRRMIALALLRIGGTRAVPSVIVACTRDPVCYRIMQETARRFTDSAFFPDHDSVVINFQAATLAQRIARAISPNHRFLATRGAIRSSMIATAGTGQYHSSAPDRRSAANMLAVIDLRPADEASILADARRLYRAR